MKDFFNNLFDLNGNGKNEPEEFALEFILFNELGLFKKNNGSNGEDADPFQGYDEALDDDTDEFDKYDESDDFDYSF